MPAPLQQPLSYRPPGRLDVGSALAPYDGPWTPRQAAHLWRRAGFGGSPDDVARTAGLGMTAAVDAFVRFPDASALPAAPQFEDDAPRTMARGARLRNLIAMQRWWLNRMIATPAPLQEKMTLFWHGHFTSAYQKGIRARQLIDQNALFRRNALGNVRELTLAVSQDPAMLRYLDNARNNKAHPNENYARELMELFTLGIGNYTEADVRESARAFTGWSLDAEGRFRAFPARHDAGTKTFLGRTGAFDGRDIVEIIFAQPAAARLFASRLLAFFVYSDPEPELIDALAASIRENDYALAPVLGTLLRSNVFFGERAYRALVKSPVEFVVGSYRLFAIPHCDLVALNALRRMGQVLFVPPNVKGWDGGAAWHNSGTVLTRENFASSLMAKMGGAPWMRRETASGDPAAVARGLAAAILQGDVSGAAGARLTAYLGGGGTGATVAFSPENADERVRGAAYLTMAMPAYQLA